MADSISKSAPIVSDVLQIPLGIVEIRRKYVETSLLKDQRKFIQADLRPFIQSQIRLNHTAGRVQVENSKILQHIQQLLNTHGGRLVEVLGRQAEAKESMAKILDKNIRAYQNNQTAIATSAGIIARSSRSVATDINGIHLIGHSVLDRIDYYGPFLQAGTAALVIQVYQCKQALEKIGRSLDGINEEIMKQNNLTAQGSTGPHGFAQHVYSYVKHRIEEVDDKKKHMFFVYHPDTEWYASFADLMRENRLPPSFCAKSADLDKLCRYLQTTRELLTAESDEGNDVVFHILIPSWYPISITQPLHFPDALQPLHVEGEKYGGGTPYVTFNLPGAQDNLLKDVGNMFDPTTADMNNTIAGVAAGCTWLVSGGALSYVSLAAGLALGAATGGGALVAIPVWWGGFGSAAMYAGLPATNAVYDYLQEEAPRILGSDQRLDI